LLTGVLFPLGQAFAANPQQITSRSLTLQSTGNVANDVNADGIPDGGSMPGATVDHAFKYTVNFGATSENIGSITFQYCTTGEPVTGGIGCLGPTGVDVSSATVADLAGSGITGWTVASTANSVDAGDPYASSGLKNQITIKVATAVNITVATVLNEALDNVVNPTTTNQTFYVRISAFSSTDGSGAATDTGTVAASTANPIYLSGTMPESLVFCTGQSISETNNVPDCATATAGNISFNKLFSSTSTAWATSQMAASTNAGAGYSITVNGPTLTSGGNTISNITAAGGALSTPGTSQFGLNVVLDTVPNADTPVVAPLSANVTTPTGNSYYHAESVAPYNTGGDATTAKYAYNTGDVVADSTSQASDPQVFTSTYLANVPGHQPAGTYTTTLTYICTATF
jgi:hypothetical protein